VNYFRGTADGVKLIKLSSRVGRRRRGALSLPRPAGRATRRQRRRRRRAAGGRACACASISPRGVWTRVAVTAKMDRSVKKLPILTATATGSVARRRRRRRRRRSYVARENEASSQVALLGWACSMPLYMCVCCIYIYVVKPTDIVELSLCRATTLNSTCCYAMLHYTTTTLPPCRCCCVS
jgi:hypothetical protein